MIESLALVSSGLFYPLESIIINCVYFVAVVANALIYSRDSQMMHDIYQMLVFVLFNVAETASNYQFEY